MFKSCNLLGLVSLLIISLPAETLWAADDLVVADFENETYEPWTVTGKAFGPGPAKGTLPNQMHVDGFRGERLVNSFYGGDGETGTLTSPPFRIERAYLAFLIGGGKNEQQLALRLIVDDKVVRSATGLNDRAGGSESLVAASWDVTEFIGKSAMLQIVDQATGGWGHINLDQIVQTDIQPRGIVIDTEREFTGDARFLMIPIKDGAPKRIVTLLVDGHPVVRNEIELADDQPDWWAPMEVESWRGKSLTIRVDQLHEDSKASRSMTMSDSITDGDNLYREPLRGQFHFSPRRGWNNDPNGLVYFNGEYHLFFQHNPYGWSWGNMHWGHAVSTDLVHWQELGDVLLPDDMGPMFSGSAVVDWNNTSGFGAPGRPPLVLIYTAAGNPTVQCLAYSTDGRQFTKYSGNPVVPEITGGNRDPKVFWHEPTQKWVMVLYVEKPADRHTVHFLTSPNLKEWQVASVIDGDPKGQRFLFECPDLFSLPIDGDDMNRRWILFGANSEYAIGSFDGVRFHPEQTHLPGHRGRGFYAAQTYSDIPAADGRRILIGWFQTETKGMSFNQSMTIPIELKLAATAEGPRMTFTPVRELEQLRTRTHQIGPATLKPGDINPLAEIHAELVELRIDFQPDEASRLNLMVRGVPIAYDAQRQELNVDGIVTSAPLQQGNQRLTIYCDRTGLEVFASDGLVYVPMPVNLDPGNRELNVAAEGGSARLHTLNVHELRSAWTTRQE
jgi:sucrose-6-phosphate hydrolase SacC (GH32 family)